MNEVDGRDGIERDFPAGIWRELVATARRIQSLRPWERSEGKLTFAIEDSATGLPVGVSIPGEREEVVGVTFYMGIQGIDFLVRLVNEFYGEDEGRDAMMRLHAYMLEFEEERYLEPEDRTLLEVAGDPAGGNEIAYPVFRCAAPGELPWLCESEDARVFLRLLQACADALEATEAAPTLLEYDYLGLAEADDGDVSKVLNEEITTDKVIDFMHENAMELDFAVGEALHEQTVENFPIWRVRDGQGRVERDNFDVRELPAGRIHFEDLTRATLQRLMEEPGRGVWEIGRRLGVPVGQPGARYYHTEILAIRSADSGAVLAAEVGKVAERSRLLGRMLKRTIFDQDTLPEKVRSDDEELLVLLDSFGREYGVAIEGDECRSLDQQLDELVQRMLGS